MNILWRLENLLENYFLEEGLEDILFFKVNRNVLVRGVLVL